MKTMYLKSLLAAVVLGAPLLAGAISSIIVEVDTLTDFSGTFSIALGNEVAVDPVVFRHFDLSDALPGLFRFYDDGEMILMGAVNSVNAADFESFAHDPIGTTYADLEGAFDSLFDSEGVEYRLTDLQWADSELDRIAELAGRFHFFAPPELHRDPAAMPDQSSSLLSFGITVAALIAVRLGCGTFTSSAAGRPHLLMHHGRSTH